MQATIEIKPSGVGVNPLTQLQQYWNQSLTGSKHDNFESKWDYGVRFTTATGGCVVVHWVEFSTREDIFRQNQL